MTTKKKEKKRIGPYQRQQEEIERLKDVITKKNTEVASLSKALRESEDKAMRIENDCNRLNDRLIFSDSKVQKLEKAIINQACAITDYDNEQI